MREKQAGPDGPRTDNQRNHSDRSGHRKQLPRSA
jgi:hypothetical protein